MGDYRRKANLGMNTMEQTAAQWAVDARVFDVNVVLVPTDGADQGKHKMADGLHTYNELGFVEDGGGGSPAAESVSVVPFLYLTSGSLTSIFRYAGISDGKGVWVLSGTPLSPIPNTNKIHWISGEGWVVLGPENGYYTSSEDVATPDLVTTWVLTEWGVDPFPSIALYPGPTVQDALEQVAAARPKAYRATIAQNGTGALATYLFESSVGTVTLSRPGAGQCSLTCTGAFPPAKTQFFGILHPLNAGSEVYLLPSQSDANTILFTAFDAEANPTDEYVMDVVITVNP